MRCLVWSLLLLPLLTACGDPPIVGYWQSDKKLGNGQRNKLEMFADYTGSAKVYATPANDPLTWIKFEFDAVWVENELSFDVDLNCDEGPCDGKENDFDMTCEVIDEEGVEYMDCEADKRWEDYPFQWERDL